jgi:hypothetical protein
MIGEMLRRYSMPDGISVRVVSLPVGLPDKHEQFVRQLVISKICEPRSVHMDNILKILKEDDSHLQSVHIGGGLRYPPPRGRAYLQRSTG